MENSFFFFLMNERTKNFRWKLSLISLSPDDASLTLGLPNFLSDKKNISG